MIFPDLVEQRREFDTGTEVVAQGAEGRLGGNSEFIKQQILTCDVFWPIGVPVQVSVAKMVKQACTFYLFCSSQPSGAVS